MWEKRFSMCRTHEKSFHMLVIWEKKRFSTLEVWDKGQQQFKMLFSFVVDPERGTSCQRGSNWSLGKEEHLCNEDHLFIHSGEVKNSYVLQPCPRDVEPNGNHVFRNCWWNCSGTMEQVLWILVPTRTKFHAVKDWSEADISLRAIEGIFILDDQMADCYPSSNVSST